LQLENDTHIEHLLMGEGSDLFLFASDSGYGFITKISDLVSNNKSGKAILTLPPDSLPLPPLAVNDIQQERLVALSSSGRMLIFPLSQLPLLPRGKGNKIIHFAPNRSEHDKEVLKSIVILPAGATLKVYAGSRHLSLKKYSLKRYIGNRGRRGQMLPHGLQRADQIEVINATEKEIKDDN
jgi:topoisomerase-4 subunit A